MEEVEGLVLSLRAFLAHGVWSLGWVTLGALKEASGYLGCLFGFWGLNVKIPGVHTTLR